MRFHKNDLLTDAEMKRVTTKIGDVFTLATPLGEAPYTEKAYTVIDIEIKPGLKHPDSGEHCTLVTLTLSDE